ncbi:SPOR domain-containing protein [Pseudoxanthomonas sp. 10H]|uniref:SPOR domain-containing protein n=1 Tax=Pseudoxanthomonas sp. 10H TaxID=3242729 RepID=UPI003558E309
MLARALIVILVALNLGVAAWWLLRPDPPAPVLPTSTAGGVELRMLAAAPMQDDTPARVASPAVPATTPATCLRLGPFPDRGAAEVAQAGLGALLRDAALTEEAGQATGYRVLLPPAGDRAQAQATAARIAAAGFEDLIVLNQGGDANAIALGAYRNRETAERRAAALRAAGFPAEVRAQGASGASRWWLDGRSVDAATVRATFPAAQDRDCATLR